MLQSRGIGVVGTRADGGAPSAEESIAGQDLARRGVVLALDVGGTELKGGLVGENGKLLRSRRSPTGAADGPDAVLTRVVALLEKLRKDAGRLSSDRILGIGIAVPGVVDGAAGVAVFGSNIPWRDTPVVARLSGALDLPVVLSHDVRAAGVAEAELGVAQGVSNFLFLALGTGISGAVFVDGRSTSGSHARAGEIGHILVEPNGVRCGCGAWGCLETVASAAAVSRRYSLRCGGPVVVSATYVFVRASHGDKDAMIVCSEAVEALAMVIATYQGILDAELVVVGGGLSLAGSLLLDALEAALRRNCVFAVMPRLERAGLGDEAGCIGAGLLARNELEGVVPRRGR